MGGKSVVGRTGSMRVYKYPESRGAGGLTSFARNFATGPKTLDAIPDDGVQVEWNSIDVGTSPDEDVPITPITTGVILISGVLSIQNTSGTARFVQVVLLVNDVPIPVPSAEAATVAANGALAVPFLTEVTDLVIGDTVNVQVQVSAQVNGALFLVPDSCSISVQEVQESTG